MALADEHSISNPGVFPDGSSVTLLDASLTLPHVIITGSLISLLWLALGLRQVRRLRAQAKPAPEELVGLLNQLTPAGKQVLQLGIVENCLLLPR